MFTWGLYVGDGWRGVLIGETFLKFANFLFIITFGLDIGTLFWFGTWNMTWGWLTWVGIWTGGGGGCIIIGYCIWEWWNGWEGTYSEEG